MFQISWLSRFRYSCRQINSRSAEVLLVLKVEGRCVISHIQQAPPLAYDHLYRSNVRLVSQFMGMFFFLQTYMPKILFQLEALKACQESASCTGTILPWFPPDKFRGQHFTFLFLLALLLLFPLYSQHTWACTFGYENTTPIACKLTDGSRGITKLISACSNMITAKVRARLSECVSTLLSWYLPLCRSIPAIWPAAAPAAYASS